MGVRDVVGVETHLTKADLKSWVSYKICRLVIFVLGLVPDFLFKIICFCSVKVSLILAVKQKAIIKRNINFIYNLPCHSSFARRFVGQVMEHQVVSALESFRFIHRADQFEFSGVKELSDNIEKCGSLGILAVTAHLGGWELLARVTAAQTSLNFFAVAKPSANRGVNKALEEMRNANGARIIWTSQGSMARDFLKVLRSGHILAFVMDQKPKNRVGPVVNFMGKRTSFVSGPAKFTLRAGAATLAFFCVREGYQRYRIISSKLTNEDDDLASITQNYTSEIERVIKLYPEQWCWNYRRWNFSEDNA